MSKQIVCDLCGEIIKEMMPTNTYSSRICMVSFYSSSLFKPSPLKRKIDLCPACYKKLIEICKNKDTEESA